MEKVDFYGYGKTVAKELYTKKEEIENGIRNKYGDNALGQFRLGFNQYVYELKNTDYFGQDNIQNIQKPDDIISGKIDVSETERNNSYFGKDGVSNKYDQYGNYADPMKSK